MSVKEEQGRGRRKEEEEWKREKGVEGRRVREWKGRMWGRKEKGGEEGERLRGRRGGRERGREGRHTMYVSQGMYEVVFLLGDSHGKPA